MTTTINASTSNGLVQSADGSGIIKLQSNGVTTNALAWVNFNGTGTVAIRSSYNVSSITDNGTGDYTVNFATALSDANYCLAGASNLNSGIVSVVCENLINVVRTTSAFRISSLNTAGGSYYDSPAINVTIHGN